MLRFDEVAVIDRNAEYRGIPAEELMENAGKKLAEVITDKFSERPVLFVCGTGNNGGDAYVAARYLRDEWDSVDIRLYLVKSEKDIRSEIAAKNFERFEGEVIEDIEWSEIDRNTVIIDAMLGTGVKGEIREPYRSVIEKINGLDNPVVSVDVPSGLGSDVKIDPQLTVTFHDIKEGMNIENSGKIEIEDIGIPEKALDHTGPGDMFLYPSPEKKSHKGENGRLLVVGGGPYKGAPALTAKAAYRTGVDLVHLAVPSSIVDVVAGYSPEFLTHPLEGEKLEEKHVDKILSLSKDCDSIVIGPGLGDDEDTIKAVEQLINEVESPMLIDADALKAVDENTDFDPPAVLTPHRGEFEMILGDELREGDIERRANSFVRGRSVVLVVKGVEDYITDGEQYRWNDLGNPAMTVGGTGDVLSGVIGALMSKGLDAFTAGRVGAYMTTRAGDKAFEDVRWGLIPEDIIETIPALFKE